MGGYKYLYHDEEKNSYIFCKEEDAEYAMIPIEEFHGMKKAVRIVRDRAVQQIDKSKCDADGYRLLRADLTYNRDVSGNVWLVTKETPYSCKIALADARSMIEQQLREKYPFMDQIDLRDYADTDASDWYGGCHFSVGDIAEIIRQLQDPAYSKYDYVIDNSERGRAMKKAFRPMILFISRISVNYAKGLYEVTYWASDCI